MAKVRIATSRQTRFGCPTEFKGLVSVDGINQDFVVSYRGWALEVGVDGVRLDADGRGSSDGVCNWGEVKDAVLTALQEYFNSDRYREKLQVMQACA